MGKGVRKKTAKGLSWSFIDNIANQGVRFICGLILARLLTPHDYGIIGIALIFVTVLEDVIDGGFTNGLIQKQNPTEADYGTAFITNIVVSLLLFSLCLFSAPYISILFKEPSLVSIVRVISFILIIDALVFVPKARLTKQMNFKAQAKISFTASVLSSFVGISMAFTGFGVWALVAQQLSRHIINTFFFWMANKWKVLLAFSHNSFCSLFSFGSKLLISDFINSVYRQLYQIVIGKFYSPSTLGQYTRAHQFSSLFSQTFTQMIQKVSFPALASIQDENEKLKVAYRTLIKSSMFIDFACLLTLAASAQPMMLTLVGKQWLPAVPYLQILCFSMLLYPLHAINLNMLKVKGRSDLFLRLEIIKKIIGLIPLALGIFFDIYWMLIGSLIENIFSYYLNSYYSGKLIRYSTKDQIKDLIPSFLVAATTASIVFLVSFIPAPYYVLFPLQVILGAFIIIGLSEYIRLDSYLEIKHVVRSIH